MTKSVYLAGPISHVSYDGANEWRRTSTARLQAVGIEAICPLRGKHVFLGHAQQGEIEKIAADTGITPRQIVTRDLNDIARSDLLLANLLDVKANGTIIIGTPMEIFYAAHDLNKPVVVVANDVRSPWLDHHAIRIFPTLDEALAFIPSYLA